MKWAFKNEVRNVQTGAFNGALTVQLKVTEV